MHIAYIHGDIVTVKLIAHVHQWLLSSSLRRLTIPHMVIWHTFSLSYHNIWSQMRTYSCPVLFCIDSCVHEYTKMYGLHIGSMLLPRVFCMNDVAVLADDKSKRTLSEIEGNYLSLCLTTYSTQNGSFLRCSSHPISWLLPRKLNLAHQKQPFIRNTKIL